MPADPLPQIVSLAAAVATVAAALIGGVLVRGSTAVPAAVWSALAATAFGLESGCRAMGGLEDPASAACVRLVVTALSLCPIMSLLGGKRPQHGVWQFIVASLAGVIALPAASAILVRPGSPPDVHPLQRWFMLLVVLVAGMNFAATRHAVAAGFVVLGQGLLVRPFLPFGGGRPESAWLDAIAACLVAAGAMLAALQSIAWPVRQVGVGQNGTSPDPAAVIGGSFLALRETLGAAWSLRIMERFNAEAESRGWPSRLRFDGLHGAGEAGADAGWRDEAIRTGRALLRRFVTPEWMRRHAGHPHENP
jgi:hypothetical protein